MTRWKKTAALAAAGLAVSLAASRFNVSMAAQTKEESQIYRIRSAETGEYVTVEGEMAIPEANLIVSSANGTLKQEFAMDMSEGEKKIVFISQSNQKDLAVNVWGTETKEGSNVNLWDKTGEDTQKWEVVQVSGGILLRSADNPSYVMGINNGNVQMEAYIQGTMDQVWELIPAVSTGTEPVDTIALSADKGWIARNHTMQVNVRCEPEDGDLRLIAWESSAPEIISVNQEGIATAKKEGTAVISAVLPNGLRADLLLAVREQEAEEITLSDAYGNKKGMLGIGFSAALYAEVSPDDTSNFKISWETSDASVCAVDTYGIVTAIDEGKATITASLDSGLKAAYEVTVSDEAPVRRQASVERIFHCKTSLEWSFISLLGGESQLMKKDSEGNSWMPSEILGVQPYKEGYREFLSIGTIGRREMTAQENDEQERISGNEEQIESEQEEVKSSNWGVIKEENKEDILLLELEKLSEGIWLFARAADGESYWYQISAADFEGYLNGFAESEEEYGVWADGETITGLFQLEASEIKAMDIQNETNMSEMQGTDEIQEENAQSNETEIEETESEGASIEDEEENIQTEEELSEEGVNEEELGENRRLDSQEEQTEKIAEVNFTKTEDGLLYENALGFTLIFPEEWEKNCTIKEAESDDIYMIKVYQTANDELVEGAGQLFCIEVSEQSAKNLKKQAVKAVEVQDKKMAVALEAQEMISVEDDTILKQYQHMISETRKILESLAAIADPH